MNEFVSNFHFLRPWLLLLLLLPIVFYKFYFSQSALASSWRNVIDKKLLKFLLIKGSNLQRKLFVHLVLIAMLVSVFIMAGPTWQKLEIPAMQNKNPVVIILNLSSDMQETDLKPNRLSRAKYKITDFLNMLKTTQTSLEVYTNEPYIIAPFSEDTAIVKNLLEKVDFDIMPSNGDRLDRALNLALTRLQSAGYTNGNLILFAADVGQKFDLAVEQAKLIAASDINLHIIAVNTQYNEKLDMVAKAAKGTYWNIQSDDAKIAALADVINKNNSQVEQGKNSTLQWLDMGWCFVIIPLLCCLMLFRKGIFIWVLLLSYSQAYAGFFTNSDQDGKQMFDEQNYLQASQNFANSDWKAASFYRMGDYAKAYQYYMQNNSIEGLYNQGNALAKSGKIKEAITKYEEVLKQNPNHEDAKFNLEYLKQQNQSSQNQQNNQNQDQNQDKQQNENQSSSSDSADNSQNSQNDNQANADNNQSSEDKNQNNQNQSQGNDNSQAENQSDSSNQEGNQQNQASANQNSDDNQNKSSNQQNDEADFLNENNTDKQGKQSSSAQMEAQEEQSEDYDEEAQARIQRYREIPEDVGGLLRSFILQEYNKNRYNEK